MTRKVFGDDSDNLINGDGGANLIYGKGGDDTLNGQAGDDVLQGQAGNDRLDGGDGNDILYGAGEGDSGAAAQHNTLIGGLGADTLYANALDHADGGAGDDRVFGAGGGDGVYTGGDGVDALVFQFSSPTAYHGDLGYLADETAGATLTLDGVTVSGFEGGQVILGGGDDQVKLARTVTHWAVEGGDGADVIAGNAGADNLGGGAGDDTVRGLGGADVLEDYSALSSDHDLVQGGAGRDLLAGLLAQGTLDGGAGNDTILAGRSAETLLGGGGADLLSADGPTSAGLLMQGGDGNDTLHGGGQADTLQGGAGHDLYRYFLVSGSDPRHPDLIQDSDGDLVVDLSKINRPHGEGRQPFTVVDAFDGGPSELVIRYDASDGLTHVEADINQDKQADLLILIEGDHTDLSQYVL